MEGDEQQRQRKAAATKAALDCTSRFSHPVFSSAEIKLELDNTATHKTLVLVDVRSEEEIAVSMIPGAITRAEFERGLTADNYQQQDSLVIVPYCTVGYRSGLYCDQLIKKGIPSSCVKNGEGIVLWTHLPGATLIVTGVIVTGETKVKQTNLCHTFGSQWDNVSPSFQAVHYSFWEMAYHGVRAFFL